MKIVIQAIEVGGCGRRILPPRQTDRPRQQEVTLEPRRPRVAPPLPAVVSSTAIRFTPEVRLAGVIRLFDVQGRCLSTLEPRFTAAGATFYVWTGKASTGSALSPGVYFMRAQEPTAGDWSRKVIVVR